MKLSSKTHYGVQILTVLGAKNETYSAKDLEKYTGVSSKYLEKVLKILLSTQTAVIRSRKAPKRLKWAKLCARWKKITWKSSAAFRSRVVVAPRARCGKNFSTE